LLDSFDRLSQIAPAAGRCFEGGLHVRLSLRCRSLFAVCGLVEISRRRRAPLRTGEASESFSSVRDVAVSLRADGIADRSRYRHRRVGVLTLPSHPRY